MRNEPDTASGRRGSGPRILLVAGEASGDLLGANLAGALLGKRPDVRLFGVGGGKMRAAGVDLVHGIERLDAMGLIGLGQLAAVVRTYRTLRRHLRETPYDAVVFIDNPGLNLRLARIARRAGQRVIYYVSPQIWAWRRGRLRLISQVVNRMLVILPFEVELYRAAGVPCEYVGHPLLDVVAPSYDRNELRKRFGCDDAGPVLGLLPGSRESEVRALLPEMLGAADRLASAHPGLRVLVAQAASIPSALIEQLAGAVPVPSLVVRDQPNEVMAAADVLLVASGTATLQAALIGTPMVITYKTTWLTYWLARLLIRIDWIGLANIVAQRSIAPEVLQDDATAEGLAREADRLLRDRGAAESMRQAFTEVRQVLGEAGASSRAAAAVLRECT